MADPRTFCEIPATARCCIVVAIVVTALSVAGLLARDSWPFTFTAAAISYVSDVAVARWHFVDADPVNRFLCYPLYYTACLMLALSPMVMRRNEWRVIAEE